MYINASQIPQNPLRELDELYARDEKIPYVDLEKLANEWIKEKDDAHFQAELMTLN